MHKFVLISYTLLFTVFTPILAQGPKRQIGIKYVGEYGGVPWEGRSGDIKNGSRAQRVKDLNLAISSINLSDNMSQDFFDRWASAAITGAKQNCAFIPRVYFWDGNDRFRGETLPVDVYFKRLDDFLDAMVKRNALSSFYAICLAEENVGSRARILSELYNRIKKKYDIQIYQWWSPSRRVPSHSVPADGWIIDNYYVSGDRYRKYAQRYLITGVPVIVMPWAAWYENQPPGWPERISKPFEDHLQLCREYNLPTAFYWVSGPTSSQSNAGFGMVYGNFMEEVNNKIFAWIKEVRAYPDDYAGLESGDYSSGRMLEAGPGSNGIMVYSDSFDNSKFVIDADIIGFRNLRWFKDKTVTLWSADEKPVSSTMTYEFAGEYPVSYPKVSIDVPLLAEGRSVSICASIDGKKWTKPVFYMASNKNLMMKTAGERDFASTKRFYIKLAMKGHEKQAVKINDLKVIAKVEIPKERVVYLKENPEEPNRLVYEDSFETKRYLYATKIKNKSKLEWESGLIGIRQRPGGTEVQVVWNVKSEKPVKNVSIVVCGMANNGFFNTNYYLSISCDGKEWETVDTKKMEHNISGWTRDDLVLSLKGKKKFENLKSFYVKLDMRAGSYPKPHKYYSAIIDSIKIKADAN